MGTTPKNHGIRQTVRDKDTAVVVRTVKLALKKWPDALQGNGERLILPIWFFTSERLPQTRGVLKKSSHCTSGKSAKNEASVSQETKNAYFALHRAV